MGTRAPSARGDERAPCHAGSADLRGRRAMNEPQERETVMKAQETSESGCISMGGTANLLTLTEKSGMGVLTGAIEGAAYGEPTGEMTDLGDGKVGFAMMHHFLDRDGSRLHTHDKAFMQP